MTIHFAMVTCRLRVDYVCCFPHFNMASIWIGIKLIRTDIFGKTPWPSDGTKIRRKLRNPDANIGGVNSDLNAIRKAVNDSRTNPTDLSFDPLNDSKSVLGSLAVKKHGVIR